MLRVLELLERGAAACVVVRDISRLSRDEFNADIGLIARECYRSGARKMTIAAENRRTCLGKMTAGRSLFTVS